jgi:hypothetical protein
VDNDHLVPSGGERSGVAEVDQGAAARAQRQFRLLPSLAAQGGRGFLPQIVEGGGRAAGRASESESLSAGPEPGRPGGGAVTGHFSSY